MPPIRAVIIGLFIGSVPALLLNVVIKVLGEAKNRPRETMYPVMVTAKPLGTGAIVSLDDISQRSLPERMVTSSLVKPDAASYVVNQPLAVPLAAGDPIPWAAFDVVGTIDGKRPAEELIKACATEMARRRIATAPTTVAALRAAILEEK